MIYAIKRNSVVYAAIFSVQIAKRISSPYMDFTKVNIVYIVMIGIDFRKFQKFGIPKNEEKIWNSKKMKFQKKSKIIHI